MEKTNFMYFGHPVNTYNSKLEDRLIKVIGDAFPRFNIENPNQEHHQTGYKKWKEKTGIGMNYYFRKVLPYMDSGIFLTFEDGKFGAGVFGEMEFLYNDNKKIWEINNQGLISLMKNLDTNRKLSIEETRERVYK